MKWKLENKDKNHAMLALATNILKVIYFVIYIYILFSIPKFMYSRPSRLPPVPQAYKMPAFFLT